MSQDNEAQSKTRAFDAGQTDKWQAAHAALLELARRRAGLDFEEGCCLLAARRAEAHRRLGYGSFTEYIERLFGYAPRLTHDKLRVAAALEGLPELARALRDGSLSFSHARELTRVATPETEQSWLESARRCTSREVEKLVSGRRPGSLPSEPAESELPRGQQRVREAGEELRRRAALTVAPRGSLPWDQWQAEGPAARRTSAFRTAAPWGRESRACN